jgi:hypothetical protein
MELEVELDLGRVVDLALAKCAMVANSVVHIRAACHLKHPVCELQGLVELQAQLGLLSSAKVLDVTTEVHVQVACGVTFLALLCRWECEILRGLVRHNGHHG